MKKFINWIKSPKSDFILFIAFLLLVNIFSNNFFKKIDLTSSKGFSLSNASKMLVSTLEEPLNIRVFFDDDMPSPYNNVSQYVKDLLEEYKSAGNKNLTVSFMDMSKPENQETAQMFGIRQVQDQILKNNEISFKLDYRGIAITYADNVEVLDPIDTANGFEYTLTSTISKMIASSDILASLPPSKKVNIDLYMTESLELLQPGICDELTEIVQEGFNAVNQKQQNRLSFKYKMIKSDDEVIEKYGFPGIRVRDENNNISLLSVGLVISYEDNFRVVPVRISNDIFGATVTGLSEVETLLTQSLQSLLSKPNQIAYLTGHGENDLNDSQYGSATFNSLLSQSYELVEINLSEQDIPLSINSLIINGPTSDYSQEELFKIDQFVMKGGNLMVFVDSFTENPNPQSYSDAFLENKNSIDTLLEKYGVTRGLNVVLDPECAKDNSTGEKAYYMPVISKKQMNKNHLVSNNLGNMYCYLNGSLDVSKAMNNKELKVSVLATSGKESWAEPIASFMPSYTDMYPSSQAVKGPQNLAVMLEGKFSSAFDKALDEEASFISSSRLPSKIFIMNSAFVTRSNFISGKSTTAIELFMMNATDYLNQNEDFCSMRTKGLDLNSLEVKSPVLAVVMQYFNEFGLTLLVIICGIIVWRLREKKRVLINKEFNPDDKRTQNSED